MFSFNKVNILIAYFVIVCAMQQVCCSPYPQIDITGGYDILGVCIRNCAQCKTMFGAYFNGEMCAESCLKFNGKIIPNLILFTQFFGFMPIENILSKDLNEIRFKWCSFHTIFSIITLISCSLEFGLFLHKAFGPNFTLDVFSGFIYFITLLGAQYTLFFKSMQWNAMMNFWIGNESVFLRRPYQRLNYKMKLNLFGFLIFVVTIGNYILVDKLQEISVPFCCALILAEYFLNFGVNNYVTYKKTRDCNLNATYGEIYYFYFKNHYFKLYPYNIMLLIIGQVIDFLNAINRSFMDILIISFSIAISSYFRALNKHIRDFSKRETSETFWISIRDHYCRITELIRYVDHEFRMIIIFSCVNNLYFICARLYACFEKFPSLFALLTFWFTFLLLLGRTVTVLFMASNINELSQEAITTLRKIPTTSWSIEVERFMEQILHERVAFSGNKYFYITRRTIFTIAGTIITFEIVLLNQLTHFTNIQATCDFI